VYLWNFVVAGVEVSVTDIKAGVADVIRSNKDVLLAERYRVNSE
jgi:hypothetical protein